MKAYCPDGQVVYTPPPKPREGLLGYVLRVSEGNGYDSPWHILSLAGIDQGQMTATTLPITKLSRVIGRSVKELGQLPWQCFPDGAPMPPLNKGAPSLLRHLLLKHPKICPQCISEHGIIDAAWDLRIMLACPTHGVPLVDACPSCGSKLRWFRPALCQCRCGHRFTSGSPSPVPQHTIDLLRVVYDTLHGLPTETSPSSRIPAADLQGLGILGLLKLLSQIARSLAEGRDQKVPPAYVNYDLDLLTRLSNTFGDWPSQFHLFLRTIDPNPSEAKIGLARRFENFYRSVVAAQDGSRQKRLFIRKAFGQYGSLDGVMPAADPRFFLTPEQWKAVRARGLSYEQIRSQIDGHEPANIVFQTDLAKRLGVRVVTAHRWALEGTLGLELQNHFVSGRPVYRVPGILPSKAAVLAMRTRAAGKYLGIPMSVLYRLRRDGYYRTRHIGRVLKQFNQADLDALCSDFLARAPTLLPSVPDNHITLRQVFRTSLNGVENKYRVLRSILDGDFSPAGRLGDTIGDIVLSAGLIQAFREDTSIHPWISATATGNLLGCDLSVVFELVRTGILEGTHRGRRLMVATQSIDAFRAKYISCATIARRLESSARHITRRLLQQNAELLSVRQRYGKHHGPTVFCLRDEAARVLGNHATS